MIRSHAVLVNEPIQEGGSAVAACGKPIVKTKLLECFENVGEKTESIPKQITCTKCLLILWETRYVFAAIESDDYSAYLDKRGIDDAAA